jgi:hypothetical protein
VVLGVGLVRDRPRVRGPWPDTVTVSGRALPAVAVGGFPQRAWRSQSSLKEWRHAGDRNATGEMTGSASRGPQSAPPTGTPLFMPRRAREVAHRRACSTRYCAASVRVPMGTIPCGVPPGMAFGEVHHSHQEGRRDARRWLKPTEDEIRRTPPQGGEPERRRDQRRTRRQAGVSKNPAINNAQVRDRFRVPWPCRAQGLIAAAADVPAVGLTLSARRRR